MLLFQSIFANISNELLISTRVLGERCKLSQRGPERSPDAKAFFRFYLASNLSKVVKSIIWLIRLNYY